MTHDSLYISGLTVYSEQGILNNASVEIDQGKIIAIHSSSPLSIKTGANRLEFSNEYYLVPGMIDLHVHGAKGKDVMDASMDSLTVMSSVLAEEGVTGFLATTMTASSLQIEQTLMVLRHFIENQEKIKGAKVLGVHLEGPFISAEKAGAQLRDHVVPLNIDSVQRWQTLSNQNIKMISFAPELSGSEAFIRYLKQQQIIPSLGHTNATYAEAMKAISEGCTHATHLFNAMRGLHQREPGIVTAALLSDSVSAEIIVDGVHLHPAIVKLALRLKQKEKLVLVTDAMRAKCLQDGYYELGGQSVEVKNNVARLKDGTLAGSTLKMSNALKNMMRFTECTLEDAVKMACENPAKILGVFDKKGSIAVGKDADLVILNKNLEVVLTLVRGRIIFQKATMTSIFS